MEFKEEVLEDKSIIAIEIKGQFDFDEIARLGVKYRQVALERGFRLIFDFRKTKGRVTVSDIQKYFSNYITPIDERLAHVPVVYISNDNDFASFKLMQQIWGNRGISIMIFKDLESGIMWFESANKT